MSPEEFEENARIITGDPTWSLTDDDDCLTLLMAARESYSPSNCSIYVTTPLQTYDL